MTEEKNLLALKWEFTDWEKAERNLREMQTKLTLAATEKKYSLVRKLQFEIVNNFENRCLAVRHVCRSNAAAGVDGVIWSTSLEKAQAALKLGEKEYHASPMKVIKFQSKNSGKIRRGHLLTYFDKAMSTLHGYALLPVLEATGDKKSFGFRPERSTQDAHSCVLDALKGKSAPEWIVCADVKAFYASIQHSWLLEHAPMNKKILAELLNAGIVFAGELFPGRELGISEGSNLSPYLGNFVLDGMQSAIYNGLKTFREEGDFANGNMIRFADDVVITVRSREVGEQVIKILEEFLRVRGLILSPEKTKIVHVAEGFTFLSRYYVRRDGLIFSYPSERAVEKFIAELKYFVNKSSLSQRRLILELNKKLSGWANYYRCTDATAAFRKIDFALKMILFEKTRSLYPRMQAERLRNKFWYKDKSGRYTYSLPENKAVKLIRLEDTVLIVPRKAKVGFNPFLNRDFASSAGRAVQNVVGKYKAVWERQGGKCYYCGRPILADQAREVVSIDPAKEFSIKNTAYVHKICAQNEYLVEDDFCECDFKRYERKNWKYRPLSEYFEHVEKCTLTLSIDEIEKILGFHLPKAAQFASFWYRKEKYRNITSTWDGAGFKIQKLDLKNKKVTFCKEERGAQHLKIPNSLADSELSADAIFELESFFDYIIKKYLAG